MLIEPTDVASYSVFEQVHNRPEHLLTQDIIEAEAEAARITGHHFTDAVYVPLPDKARLALLKLAQYFALVNSDETSVSSYQSEKWETILTPSQQMAVFKSLTYITCFRNTLLPDILLRPPNSRCGRYELYTDACSSL